MPFLSARKISFGRYVFYKAEEKYFSNFWENYALTSVYGLGYGVQCTYKIRVIYDYIRNGYIISYNNTRKL